MNYVVGFCFKQDASEVVLIQKLRPEWQNGLINGVGGKVEPEEDFSDAMVREFEEETGVKTTLESWDWRARILLNHGRIDVFTVFNDDYFSAAKTVEEEQIVKLPTNRLRHFPVVPNLKWLIPFLLDENVSRNIQRIDFTTEAEAPPKLEVA